LYSIDVALSVESNENIEQEGFFGIGKQKPKHKWHALKALTERYVSGCLTVCLYLLTSLLILAVSFCFRNLGTSSHKNIDNAFNDKCYGSLRFVERLELAFKMDCHNGCVNALHFNSSGSRLASGSDDLSIIIW
jgi:hypothetical protein